MSSMEDIALTLNAGSHSTSELSPVQCRLHTTIPQKAKGWIANEPGHAIVDQNAGLRGGCRQHADTLSRSEKLIAPADHSTGLTSRDTPGRDQGQRIHCGYARVHTVGVQPIFWDETAPYRSLYLTTCRICARADPYRRRANIGGRLRGGVLPSLGSGAGDR
jgi:hypothetical protein